MRRLYPAYVGRTVSACSDRLSAGIGAFRYILGDKGSDRNGRWRACDNYGNFHRILEQFVIFVLGIGHCRGYWLRDDDCWKMGKKKTDSIYSFFVGRLYGGDVVELSKKTFLKRCVSVMAFKLEGVFTVEAALVVPVVIGCLLFVILMAFSLHDYAVLKAASAEEVTGGFIQKGESAGVSLLYYRNYIWEKENEKIGGLIQDGHRYQVRYQVEENNLIGRLTGVLTGGYDENNFLCVKGVSEYVRSSPVKMIWRCQVLTDPFEGGEGTDGNQIPLGAE